MFRSIKEPEMLVPPWVFSTWSGLFVCLRMRLLCNTVKFKKTHLMYFLVCVSCFAVFNIIIWTFKSMDYTSAKHYKLSLPTPNKTFVKESKKQLQSCGVYETFGYTDFAFVSITTSEGKEGLSDLALYVKSAAKLAVSIKQWTNMDTVMMVFGITPLPLEHQTTLTLSGWILCYMNSIESPNSSYSNRFLSTKMYSKLNVWSLIEYEAVVMLDADMIVIRDPVPLLTEIYPAMKQFGYAIAAVEDVPKAPTTICNYTVSKYNAGVLVLKPDRLSLLSMKDAMHTLPHKAEYAEQAFLNVYFKNNVYPMQYRYNVNMAAPLCEPDLWNREYDNFTVIHYTVNKPWLYYESSYINWLMGSNAWKSPAYMYLLWEWTPMSLT